MSWLEASLAALGHGLRRGVGEREGGRNDDIQIPGVGTAVEGGRAPARQAPLAWGRAGARALSGGREEPSKGWQLRRDLVAFTSIRRLLGGTTWMKQKGRQGPQEQRGPASGRDRAVRPEPAERVPTQHLKVAHQEGTGEMALQGSTWWPEARNQGVGRAHSKHLNLLPL